MKQLIRNEKGLQHPVQDSDWSSSFIRYPPISPLRIQGSREVNNPHKLEILWFYLSMYLHHGLFLRQVSQEFVLKLTI